MTDLYPEIKAEWNRLRLKEDADPEVLRFLSHLMDLTEYVGNIRLVDIDALRADWKMPEHCDECNRTKCDMQMVSIRDICGWLDDAETIDVYPVRHARLINNNCSECGWYIYSGDADNYCPHCGAKLEGSDETE